MSVTLKQLKGNVLLRDLFFREGNVYRVKHWCEEPTVTFVNIETGEVISGAVSSKAVQELTLLRPYEPEDSQ